MGREWSRQTCQLHTCYTSLTVNHILIECPQFNHLRQQYHFGSTLKELYNNTSVNDIIAFFKDTHFYTRIQLLLYLVYISYKPWF